MTFSEFIVAVAQETGLGKSDADKAVRGVIATLRRTLAQGEAIRIAGLGRFQVAERGPRQGRNLQTGAALTIPAAKVVQFRPGSELKTAVNPAKTSAKGKKATAKGKKRKT